MSTNLNAIDSWVQPITEHLINGLILSAIIFLGSLLVFRYLFREQRLECLYPSPSIGIAFQEINREPIAFAVRTRSARPCSGGPKRNLLKNQESHAKTGKNSRQDAKTQRFEERVREILGMLAG